ncbi:unnamed protein product [Candidula unifasciata]|uniref:C-type lectin domain-containing protein n=1 Tax=Candidula unifasciata TaxID=100452 RepID=A0A8S3ZF58_9EUPU|nr:unnamed protein product [Candidula unifasciata]
MLSEIIRVFLDLCTIAELQAYGCAVGWTDFEDFCYKIQVEEDWGATLSSVWSEEERTFIISLWQFPTSDLGFLWLGMRGDSDGDWVFDDQSSVKTKKGDVNWSIFANISGMPTATTKKCVAFRSSGSLAFLDCGMPGDAFVCKKALSKVFITSSLGNSSSPWPANKAGHIRLFERILPPSLTSLPAGSSLLAEMRVETEIGCAFNCFSVNGCRLFQVNCEIRTNCGSFWCALYADFVR